MKKRIARKNLDEACEWLSQELIYPTSNDEVEWAKLEIEKFRKYITTRSEQPTDIVGR